MGANGMRDRVGSTARSTRKPMVGIVALLLALGAIALIGQARGASTPTEAAPTERPPGNAVALTVIDADGAPLAGADVVYLALARNGRALFRPIETRTDEAGQVSFEVPAESLLRVAVTADGWAPILQTREPEGSIRVELTKGRPIHGRVIDAQGQAIAHAAVYGCEAAALVLTRRACAQSRADASGRFSLDHAPATATIVGVEAPGRALPAWEPVAADSTGPLTFRLTSGIEVRGVVLDGNGKPIPDVPVVARAAEDRSPAERPRPAHFAVYSDAEGRFRLPGFQRGRQATIEAIEPSRLRSEPEEILLEGPGPVDVEIVLFSGGSLQFGLISEDGDPLSGRLEVLPIDLQGPPDVTRFPFPPSRIHQAEGGRYEVVRVEAGTYTFELNLDGYVTRRLTEVQIDEGAPTDLGPIELERSPSIEGRVTAEDGEPIVDAQVSSRRFKGASDRSAMTGEDGRYRLAVNAERSSLFVRAKGYAPQSLDDVQLGATGVDFVLEPTGGITGTVEFPPGIDEAALPKVYRVEVSTPFDVSRAFAAENFHSSRQVARGRPFEVDNVPAGAFSVEIYAQGLAPHNSSAIQVESGRITDMGEIRLEEGWRLNGEALEQATQRPVAGASVQIRDASEAYSFGPVLQQATTDADGRFEVAGITPGNYRVVANHPDYAPAESRFSLTEGLEAPLVRLAFQPGGVLVGTVRERTGTPIERAWVAVSSDQFTLAARAESNASGAYSVSRLAGGAYTVTWGRAGTATPIGPPKQVSIRAGDEVRLDLSEQGRIRLSGTVSKGPEPVASATLMLMPAETLSRDAMQRAIHAETDAAGRYDVMLEHPGSYTVVVRPSLRSLEMKTVNVEIPDESEVARDIVLPGNRIAGVVLDADEQPVADGFVALIPAGMPLDQTALAQGGFELGQTDATGRFSFDGVEPQAYELAVARLGATPKRMAGIEVEVDSWIEDLEIRLEPTSNHRLRVVDPAGLPIAQAAVSLIPIRQGLLSASTALTDGSGMAQFELSLEGPFEWLVVAAGWAFETGDVAQLPEGEPLEISLAPGRSVVVELFSEDGPIADLDVRVQAVDGPPLLRGQLNWPTRSDARGRARVGDLRPGRYRVDLPRHPDLGERTVELGAETDTRVEWRLPDAP